MSWCFARLGGRYVISDEEFERAEKRGRELIENVPHAVEACYVPALKRILVLLSDGMEISLRTNEYLTTQNATDEQLSTIELFANGFEIHFPKLDEGFWVPDLLEHLLGVRKFLRHRIEEQMVDYERQRAAA
jgi:hypothetical protein